MERVAAGEEKAQRELALRLVGRARRVSLALLRHGADADDATQVALLELLRSAKTYRGDGTLEKWADRIVARTAIRLARTGRARSALDATADSEDIMGAGADEPGSTMDVHRYLEHLSEPRRTALVLRHMMGHSVEEIASLTGVSPNTVKDRLVQALQQVREMVRRS